MNIVIGAKGQDGSYVCDQLISLGYPVVGLCRNGVCIARGVSDEDEDILRSMGHRLMGWVSDSEILSEFLVAVNAKAVFDCAASHTSTNKFGKGNQKEMYILNLRRTTCIQDALITCLEKGYKPRLVTCGSSLMYSGQGGLRVNEDTEMNPKTGYGYAKVVARKQCGALRCFGLEASMAILFNHDSVRRSREYFLPRAIKAVDEYSRKGVIEPLGCLRKQIDIGSARDVASALIRISQAEDLSSDYVVATGKLIRLGELVDYIGERYGFLVRL